MLSYAQFIKENQKYLTEPFDPEFVPQISYKKEIDEFMNNMWEKCKDIAKMFGLGHSIDNNWFYFKQKRKKIDSKFIGPSYKDFGVKFEYVNWSNGTFSIMRPPSDEKSYHYYESLEELISDLKNHFNID